MTGGVHSREACVARRVACMAGACMGGMHDGGMHGRGWAWQGGMCGSRCA